jgi:glycosyltransferase involved in cell wall biosynthesis
MKLGIISDCIHYKNEKGEVGTENHILLRQLQTLSTYFSETMICCPFGDLDNKRVITYYTNRSISFTSVPVVGGDRVKDKISLVKTIPSWFEGFKKIDAFSDIVYQRFPNNLNIPGFFYFYFKQKKVFATYTGTWLNYKSEPPTYRFQKWLLKKFFRGPVWIYGGEELFTHKLREGFSPSYSKFEWDEETLQVERRISKLKESGLKIFRLITVGTLISYKNQLTILKACFILKKHNFPFYLTIVGDGPMYKELEAFIADNDLGREVQLVGKKNHVELRQLYRENDFVVQAPLSEGFGKVPVEGFFHGAIPVISDISLARHLTNDGKRGFLFNARHPNDLADVLLEIGNKQKELPSIITLGREFAKTQTLEKWADDYYKTILEFSDKD